MDGFTEALGMLAGAKAAHRKGIAENHHYAATMIHLIGKTVRSHHGKGYLGVVEALVPTYRGVTVKLRTASGILMLFDLNECMEVEPYPSAGVTVVASLPEGS